MIWSLFPTWINYVSAAVLAAFLLAGSGYYYGKVAARHEAALEAAQASIKAIETRVGVNEKVKSLDNVALCIELGGLRDQCEQLRGLATDQP